MCIVVHDIGEAVEYYERLGIGPWSDFANPAALTELSVPNREAFFAMRYKCAELENIQLQLCQPPLLDCPQRRFLNEHGEGIFHVGFAAEDIDGSEDVGRALGLTVLMRGRRGNGTGFTYFDTHEGAGVTLMVRSAPASSPSTDEVRTD
ncbi:VOC family protein [Streptomyces sioyaensis]|uniref:VOC family protein n=1 Tax=Streptomyces sioyaensis TaxID=67364 RepID=UPI0037D63D5B